MPVQLGADLNRFRAFVAAREGLKVADDDAAVRLSGGQLTTSECTSGKVSRAFSLSDKSKIARGLNDEVRTLFLKAVRNEFDGIESIPPSVRDALKLKDYGDGAASGRSTSGRPRPGRLRQGPDDRRPTGRRADHHALHRQPLPCGDSRRALTDRASKV